MVTVAVGHGILAVGYGFRSRWFCFGSCRCCFLQPPCNNNVLFSVINKIICFQRICQFVFFFSLPPGARPRARRWMMMYVRDPSAAAPERCKYGECAARAEGTRDNKKVAGQ